MSVFDQDALVAAVDLVGRMGAVHIEVGYLHDDAPIERAGWYAHAQYRGSRVTVEDQVGPVEAAEGLARRLLDGGTCRRCGQTVRLEDGEGCRWTRMGTKWVPGCDKPIDRSIPVPPFVRDGAR